MIIPAAEDNVNAVMALSSATGTRAYENAAAVIDEGRGFSHGCERGSGQVG